MMRRRRRHGRRGRIPTPVFIGQQPVVEYFIPYPDLGKDTIFIDPAEIEALRLVDLEGLSQEEAGVKMGVSRGTVWRLLQGARMKVTKALTDGRRIQILLKNENEVSDENPRRVTQ